MTESMVGTVLKSKINEGVFLVEQEYEDNGKTYYLIVDMRSRKCYPVEKGWFEKGIMLNMKILEVNDE